jgi:endonuclease-3
MTTSGTARPSPPRQPASRRVACATPATAEETPLARMHGPFASAERVAAVMKVLGRAIREMELPAIEKLQEDNAATAFQTLIATMLSAQTKDAVTHAASVRLFARAGTPDALAALPTRTIEKLIYPVSFYRNKARHVKVTARDIVERFGGQTPSTLEELLTLRGVGRKTATLVLIVAHASADHICVDTHVHRISNRLGWVRTKTPALTEQTLYEVAPKRWWRHINLHLVTWGQQVCRPVYPKCAACVVRNLCPRIGVTREGRV